jgi:hypothetical protein
LKGRAKGGFVTHALGGVIVLAGVGMKSSSTVEDCKLKGERRRRGLEEDEVVW